MQKQFLVNNDLNGNSTFILKNNLGGIPEKIIRYKLYLRTIIANWRAHGGTFKRTKRVSYMYMHVHFDRLNAHASL